jgi:hypothetical protein
VPRLRYYLEFSASPATSTGCAAVERHPYQNVGIIVEPGAFRTGRFDRDAAHLSEPLPE